MKMKVQTLKTVPAFVFTLMLVFSFLFPQVASAHSTGVGGVYVISNSPGGNAVLAFDRAADGSLAPAGSYPTGGSGSGAALNSQGALAINASGRWLFAVNAGSNSVSSFRVSSGGLALADVAASGGTDPVSVTTRKNLLYVLNAGGSGSIQGFRVSDDGDLSAIPGSNLPLSNLGSGAAPGPAEIAFSRDGRSLVVTEKASNMLDVYSVDEDGSASGPTSFPSAGTTPYGFAFGRQNTLVVSEAFGGAPLGSAASSYKLSGGQLSVVSASSPTHQTAACWIAITNNGKFAYAANAGSGSISGYAVSRGGSLTLLDADGITGMTGAGSTPVDMAISHNSQYLYVLGAGTHMIYGFAIDNGDGSLSNIPGISVPAGSAGIAAW